MSSRAHVPRAPDDASSKGGTKTGDEKKREVPGAGEGEDAGKPVEKGKITRRKEDQRVVLKPTPKGTGKSGNAVVGPRDQRATRSRTRTPAADKPQQSQLKEQKQRQQQREQKKRGGTEAVNAGVNAVPNVDAMLLASLAEGSGARAGKVGRKKRARDVRVGHGLDELHRALHLSDVEGISDITRVIKAEPLEERRMRVLAEKSVKKKRGRPRVIDSGPSTEPVVTQRADIDDSIKGDEGAVSSSSESELKNNVEDEVEKPGLRRSQRKRTKKNYAEEGVTTESSDEKKKPQSKLADKDLDPENWTLRDIVKWGNARDRKIAKEMSQTNPEMTPPKPSVTSEKTEPMALYPQVLVKDGKVVVNRESLTVTAQQKEDYTRVVTDEAPRLNSMSYVNRLANDRWTVGDTELFFRVSVWARGSCIFL